MCDLRVEFGVSSSWNQDQLFHIAVENGGDGRIVGYVKSTVKKETNEETNECKIYAEITNILVAIRQRGIASKLVTAAHKDLERVCLFVLFVCLFVCLLLCLTWLLLLCLTHSIILSTSQWSFRGATFQLIFCSKSPWSTILMVLILKTIVIS
jgi:predicted GNAT family acetyltransferase